MYKEANTTGHRYEKGRYVWHELDLVEVQHDGYTSIEFVHPYPNQHHSFGENRINNIYTEGFENTVVNHAKRLNAEYVRRVISPRIAELTSYVVWQEKRVREWAPGTLKAVEAPKQIRRCKRCYKALRNNPNDYCWGCHRLGSMNGKDLPAWKPIP